MSRTPPVVSWLVNRVQNLSARAVARLVGDSKPVQRVQVELLRGELRELQRVQEYGFSSVPLVGAFPVIALAPFGDRAQMVVIAADDVRHRPTGGAPGDVLVYHHGGSRIRLTATGIVVEAVGGLEVEVSGDASVSAQAIVVNATTVEVNATEATVTASEVTVDSPSVELGSGTVQALANAAFVTLYASHEHPNGGGGTPTGVPTVPPVPATHLTVNARAS